MRQVLEHIVGNEFGKKSYFEQVLFTNDPEEIGKVLEI